MLASSDMAAATNYFHLLNSARSLSNTDFAFPMGHPEPQSSHPSLYHPVPSSSALRPLNVSPPFVVNSLPTPFPPSSVHHRLQQQENAGALQSIFSYPLCQSLSPSSSHSSSSTPTSPHHQTPRSRTDFSMNAILGIKSKTSPKRPERPPVLEPEMSHQFSDASGASFNPFMEAGFGLRGSGALSRKQRTVYHFFQIEHLERAFQKQQYMVGTDRSALAKQLGLTETQVRVWFQNRRSKWRKDSREEKKVAQS